MEIKIKKKAEDIISDIQFEFGDEYDIDIKEKFSTSNILNIYRDSVYLKIMVATHYEHNYAILSSDDNNKYVTITVIDYYGNTTCISLNYIEEIKAIIKSIEDRINEYCNYVEDILDVIIENSDGLSYIINDKNHFFIQSKNTILRIKPIIKINDNKTSFTVTPINATYNEPVLEYNIDSENKDILDDISFFL